MSEILTLVPVALVVLGLSTGALYAVLHITHEKGLREAYRDAEWSRTAKRLGI